MTSKFDYKLFTDVELVRASTIGIIPTYCDAFIESAEYDGRDL